MYRISRYTLSLPSSVGAASRPKRDAHFPQRDIMASLVDSTVPALHGSSENLEAQRLREEKARLSSLLAGQRPDSETIAKQQAELSLWRERYRLERDSRVAAQKETAATIKKCKKQVDQALIVSQKTSEVSSEWDKILLDVVMKNFIQSRDKRIVEQATQFLELWDDERKAKDENEVLLGRIREKDRELARANQTIQSYVNSGGEKDAQMARLTKSNNRLTADLAGDEVGTPADGAAARPEPEQRQCEGSPGREGVKALELAQAQTPTVAKSTPDAHRKRPFAAYTVNTDLPEEASSPLPGAPTTGVDARHPKKRGRQKRLAFLQHNAGGGGGIEGASEGDVKDGEDEGKSERMEGVTEG
ncbi:hypothetical protein P171DRAFT_514574 [Karstenula rhodostoma CBS 690.94]|uniref:Uncharacterized protein n=1 Tax=Karstenula rhodostoma CBS 690.94 TaxID=1392251 RepID=A0A9P4PLB4_9PLEO|nr:hypothetical protein P171DRAFT_514574 [Karstenula rhodostoma CBS 690.94]